MYTIEEIQNMSDEEAKALKAELGKKVAKKFGISMITKWSLIFGASYFARRLIESKSKK